MVQLIEKLEQIQSQASNEITFPKIRKHQVRVLKAIREAGGPLNRHALKEYGDMSDPTLWDAIGRVDPELTKKRDIIQGYPCLITLGYVEMREIDLDGKSEKIFDVTPLGNKALDKIIEEELIKERIKDAKRQRKELRLLLKQLREGEEEDESTDESVSEEVEELETVE